MSAWSNKLGTARLHCELYPGYKEDHRSRDVEELEDLLLVAYTGIVQMNQLAER